MVGPRPPQALPLLHHCIHSGIHSVCVLPWNFTLKLRDNKIVHSIVTGLSPLLENVCFSCLVFREPRVAQKANEIRKLLDGYSVSSQASFKKHWSRQMTRYQAVTVFSHCTLYRQQIRAIFFLFSALGAEMILSFGYSWLFFFCAHHNTLCYAHMHDYITVYSVDKISWFSISPNYQRLWVGGS